MINSKGEIRVFKTILKDMIFNVKRHSDVISNYEWILLCVSDFNNDTENTSIHDILVENDMLETFLIDFYNKEEKYSILPYSEFIKEW